MKKLLYYTAIACLISCVNLNALNRKQTTNNAPGRANASPVVTNVTAVQRLDGSKIIDIWYDLADADGDSCTVSLKLSHNGGATYTLIPSETKLSGDLGSNISPGTGKHIIWNAGDEHFYLDGQYIYRVEALDKVEAGEFIQVATTSSQLLVAKTEVTQASYQQVMGTNPSNVVSDPDYPVHNVTYWDAVKYCNQRSLEEGLVPYYIWRAPCHSYPSPYAGYVWPDWPEAGQVGDYFPVGANYVYWTYSPQHMSLGVTPRVFQVAPYRSNGYRLLTEAEWEFVARGGSESQNYTYSGANVADSVAWFDQNSSGLPHPVGLKAPNELGIYDLSGNVQEWVFETFRHDLPMWGMPPFTPLKWTTIGTCKGGWWASGETNIIPDYSYNREAGTQSQPINAYPTYQTAGFRICRTLEPDTYPAAVTISPAGISYNAPVQVTMTCPSQDSYITFTTDGTTPNQSSVQYTEPITLHHSTVLKARAFSPYGYGGDTATETYTISLPQTAENNMVLVEGGVFDNGVSNVTLSSFYISESEIRQADFYPLMGGCPSAGQDLGLSYPANGISWFQAIAYCNKLSIAEGLVPCYAYDGFGTNPNDWPIGWDVDSNQDKIKANWYSANGYRLPTEMEWMFAAQGGSVTQNYQYAGSDTLGNVAWYEGNSANNRHQAMSLNPNELGLYDMSGNVMEWCWDYQASNYPSGDQLNPIGPLTGSSRIVRGGSYNRSDQFCNTDYRAWLPPSTHTSDTGFRICRQIMPSTILGSVDFSLPSGIYTELMELSLSCTNPNAAIRYTLNGSTPTEFDGNLYNPSEPIRIFSNVTIKAIAFLPGFLSSPVAVAEFTFFNDYPDDFVFVPDGAFTNESSNVFVSSFFIDNTEITQAEYQAIMSENPSTGYGEGTTYPVYGVTWFDAVEYCNRRSILEGLQSCYTYQGFGTDPDFWPSGWNTDANHTKISLDINQNGYRLPTEMEWMYSAKGGRYSQAYIYCGADDPDSVAWHNGNSAGTNHPVGNLNPNELGIYDLGGNVSEWCWDIYDNYPITDLDNSYGPVTGTNRVLRGGDWSSPANQCTAVFRSAANPTTQNSFSGFRVCRSAIATYTACEAPLISPEAGFYNQAIYASLTSQTPGTYFHYTIDGTEPGITNGTLYTAPVYLYRDTEFKALAFHAGYHPSTVVMAEYSITDQPLAAPAFSPNGGNFELGCTVNINCATPLTQIRYTMDGTEPSPDNGTLYTNPIHIIQNTTLIAIALRDGSSPSEVTTAEYIIDGIPPIDLYLVGGGTFFNGTSNITLSDFYLGKTEVTQASYTAVMGSNPAAGYGSGAEYPVYNTTWFNAVEYCNRRSIVDGLDPVYTYNNGTAFGSNPGNWPAGWNQVDSNQNFIFANWNANGYRLPTEMEWMFAAKGGNLSQNYNYCGSNDINAVSWYNAVSGNSTHPTGVLLPNELGLYDMGGNVWEWCWDFHADAYPGGDQTNPTGPATGLYRLLRGASAFSPADQCTAYFRNTIWPTFVSQSLGFRVVRKALH